MKILIVFCLALIIFGCTKYPDGPAVSFVPRKARMVNHWQLVKATANGESWTPFFPLKQIELLEDQNQTSTFSTLNVETILSGQWEFESKKERLNMIYTSTESQDYKILKLKSDELKLSYVSNDTTYIIEYETYK